MANSFGSLYIGVAGLQSNQNALNITSNNLANVDTTGYVRQRVIYADRNYMTTDTTAAISYQQSGLGVKIGDVIHTRDVFLDKSYRTEAGREAFYSATYEAVQEVETLYQELEGQTFQDAIEDFWQAFQELAKAPDDSIYQNLVIQKAELFLSRSSAVYSGIQSYQYNINTQIADDIDRINELGKNIYNLNLEIMKVESGGVETAMTLRDERDLALDELASYVDITYHEDTNGQVKVELEGVPFIDEAKCYEIGAKYDYSTGFITAYWPQLSDTDKDRYVNVFNFSTDISSENKNDIGELKALLLARGDHPANYTDIEGLDADTYNDTTGMSVMLMAEAQLDQMIHGMVTAINDLLSPTIAAGDTENPPAFPLTAYDADGNKYTITADTKILDAENCARGIDGELPPRELFTRIGCDRYTKVTGIDGNEYYIYNEEDPNDTTKQYTIKSLSVNEELTSLETLIPHLMKNGDVAVQLGEALVSLWDNKLLTLNPNDTGSLTFKEYYQNMTDGFATLGNVYKNTSEALEATTLSIDNQRQQVIGVSSDEELTYMIKYQNAYNASSRFINVINEMIETLLTQVG
jgi:flagellar hook-associated protein 1 FlgK